ncbi:MAG TPA: zinc-dependent alcohol dehydrogenase family protein [Terriglobales bacterium]|nr:zinc-dependent alcohol dehydrogenase family protein [Terriglobales bacterium]
MLELPAKMRAAILHHQRPIDDSPLRLGDLPIPEPQASQIRVKVSCCGLCHTDLHTVEGDLPAHRLPIVPGHQVVGTVEKLGPGASRFHIGSRVGIPWLHRTDGTCDFCRRDLENLCPNAQFTGYDADGGYAEYTVVDEDFAYPIPPQFTDLNAAPLLCAGIIGYRSFRLSGAKAGDRLGLYGFGASAHIVIQFARHLGCEVLVFTRSEHHRHLARELGAAWTGRAEDTPPKPLDAAIIFAPAGSLVPEALRVTRKAGTVALAGITMSQIPAMNYDLLYHERVLRSVANSTRQDAREFLELAAKVPVKTEVETYELADINRALQDLKHSRIRGAGVVRVAE